MRVLKLLHEIRNPLLVVLPKANLLGLTQDLFKVGLKLVRLGLGPVEMCIDRPLQPPRPDPILFIMDRKDNLLALGCELGGDKLRRVVHSARPVHDQCTVVIRDLSLLV